MTSGRVGDGIGMNANDPSFIGNMAIHNDGRKRIDA